MKSTTILKLFDKVSSPRSTQPVPIVSRTFSPRTHPCGEQNHVSFVFMRITRTTCHAHRPNSREKLGGTLTNHPAACACEKDLLWFSPLTPRFHPLLLVECWGVELPVKTHRYQRKGNVVLCEIWPTLLSIQTELSFRTEVLVLLAGPKAPE